MSRRPEMTQGEIRGTYRELHRAAWADATPDNLRVVLWNAYDAIRQQRREIAALQERLVTQAVALERAEADNERFVDRILGWLADGHVPFGWSLDADGVTLVQCDEEQLVIEAIVRCREAGMSHRRIAEILTAKPKWGAA